jgi:hypothetical protein
MLRQQRNGPLEIGGETMVVDTTDFDEVDYGVLLRTIDSRLSIGRD